MTDRKHDRNKRQATPTSPKHKRRGAGAVPHRRSSRLSSDKREVVKKKAESPKGARRSVTDVRGRLSSWLGHHRFVAVDALSRLLKTPLASLLSCLVIAVALALPAGLLVALQNAERLSAGWDTTPRLSVFLYSTVTDAEGREIAERIRQRRDVASVNYISSIEALEQFKAESGMADVFEHLDGNPLPAVIDVSPVTVGEEPMQQLQSALQDIIGVEQVLVDMAWVQRLQGILDLARVLVLGLAGLLLTGVVLVMGNTIRLSIEARRDEIVIIKLVGGTNAFVRRPFLYTGLWYGLGGGVLAWCLVQVGLLGLSASAESLAALYNSDFRVSGLGFVQSVQLWVLGAALGLGGAWLAVARQLRGIEPV